MGEAPRGDVTKDVFVLDKLRAGLPEIRAENSGGGGGTVVINICPIASGTFFTKEACEHLRLTGQLPPDALIHLIDPIMPAEQPPEATVLPLHPLLAGAEDDEPPGAA
jgi:hypothetical protein